MRDIIAELRTLVLPYGATSGERIVLDGILGEILIYDSTNALRLRLGHLLDGIELFSAIANEVNPGFVFARGIGAGATRQTQLDIATPQTDTAGGGGTRVELDMRSQSYDGTIAPSVVLLTRTLDIQDALGLARADLQVNSRTIGRGTLDFVTNGTNVTLSTTAGTYTTVVTGNSVTLTSGRRYLITLAGGDNLLSGGSGFATTDTWKQKAQVNPLGGGFVDLALSGPTMIARAPLAATFRYGIPVHVGYYVAASNGAHTFRWVASKTSGAATVTSTMETGTGASPFTLQVEDVGI